MKKLYIIKISKQKLLYLSILTIFILAVIITWINLSSKTTSTNWLNTIIPNSIFTDNTTQSNTGGMLAIIIDDFGSGRNGVKEMMSIDRHLTFAVLPFCEHTQEDAMLAHQKGYEVIVHLPMEPKKGKKSWLGSNPILAGMSSDNVEHIVRVAFDDVPFAAGANIHMGSKASSEENVVSAVLNVINERKVYFVDSCTASHPIGKRLGSEKGVLCYDRDVFLDGQQPKSFVKKRLKQAIKIAQKKGYAIAIGHVGIEGGKVTAEAINEMLPEFDEKNIKLVFVSELKL